MLRYFNEASYIYNNTTEKIQLRSNKSHQQFILLKIIVEVNNLINCFFFILNSENFIKFLAMFIHMNASLTFEIHLVANLLKQF